jgi:phosphoribosylformimino-5-aminoimidazole carboxamide ribotide isomerase
MVTASAFELLAAIDLRGGQVVRLRQGDFDQETTYGTDPVAVARALVDKGAPWLHIVDLDGAREGRRVQASIIDAVIAAIGADAQIEVAGGLRTVEAIEAAIHAGATRVVLGTAALRDPGLATQVISRFGADRVAVALDISGDRPVVDGWIDPAGISPAADALRGLADAGVTSFEVTAVERDGMLVGPDLDLLRRLVGLDHGRVIASGGITTLEDLRAVRDLGCAGAIVGRAIYEGALDLGEAMEAVATAR